MHNELKDTDNKKKYKLLKAKRKVRALRKNGRQSQRIEHNDILCKTANY